MRAILRNAFVPLVLAGLASGQAAFAQTTVSERAMIVFDGSGSMWGQIDGQNKIVIARETLSRTLPTLPPDMEIGLIAYGHNRRGDCGDIATLVDVGPASQQSGKIASAVAALNPKGKTPLSEAVRRAAEALRYTEERATVILITDGLETCEADPCALATELDRLGIDFTAHVIGFGLTDEEGRQVACLAENTGGLYLPARDAADLAGALAQTVATAPVVEPEPLPAPEPQPEPLARNLVATVSLDESSAPLNDGDGLRVNWTAEPIENGEEVRNLPAVTRLETRFPPGRYRLTARTNRGSVAVGEIETTDTELTSVNLILGAGTLDLFAAMVNEDLGLYDTDFIWNVENEDTGETFNLIGKAVQQVVPSGRYSATLTITRLTKVSPGSASVEVVTGKTGAGEVIAASSKILLRAFNPDRSELKRHDVRFQIYKGTDTQDQPAFVAMRIGGDPIILTPGPYAVRIEAWDGTKRSFEERFEVGVGENREVEFSFP
ncbi:MAG: VWA domain-containing protein [Pseudomonadota bacterium]